MCPGFFDVDSIKKKKQKHEIANQVMRKLIKPEFRQSGLKPTTFDSEIDSDAPPEVTEGASI